MNTRHDQNNDHELHWYSFGTGEPAACFIAGIHGREYSGIETAFRLCDSLHGKKLKGRVMVLPLVNSRGASAASRDNPQDGTNLNDSFKEPFANTPSGKLAAAVWETASQSPWIIDLHAAGKARYLPHVIIHNTCDSEIYRYFGLSFLILRSKGNTLTSLALSHGKKSCALELGGGMVVFDEDINRGLAGITAFLTIIGVLEKPVDVQPTPQERIYSEDTRAIVKVKEDGILIHEHALGDELKKGEVIGTLLVIENQVRIPILSPKKGIIIYRRTEALIRQKETAYMVL